MAVIRGPTGDLWTQGYAEVLLRGNRVANGEGFVRGVCRAFVPLVFLAGCDPQKVSELEEGVSTEQDVRARFGTPELIWSDTNGDRTFEYPRQPAGHTNYMISIGPDGKMTSLRQVLHPSYFARVTPGLKQEEVRRLLGKPAKVQFYKLQQTETWDWRFSDGATEIKVFSVTFDSAGSVVSTGVSLDPKEAGQRG